MLTLLQILFTHSFTLPKETIKLGKIAKNFRLGALSLYSYEPWALMIRLYIMDPYTDYFVLGYCNMTISGKILGPMSLHPFEADIQRLYQDKLYFQTIDIPLSLSNQWDREIFLKNSLLNAPIIGNDDLLYFSDSDEVPTEETLQIMVSQSHTWSGPQYLTSTMFNYHLRMTFPGKWHQGYFIWRSDLGVKTLNDFRQNVWNQKECGLPGVHLSFFFPTLKGIIKKLKSYAHIEYSGPPYIIPEYIYTKMACMTEVDRNFVHKDLRDEFFWLIPDLNDPRFDFFQDGIFEDFDILNFSNMDEYSHYCRKAKSKYKRDKVEFNERKKRREKLGKIEIT